MRRVPLAASLLLAASAAAASPGPRPLAYPPAIAAPQDRPFPGVIRLLVDASDVRHRVYRVRETIPVLSGRREMVLLYPQWLPGDHAPEGPIDRFAGLKITAAGGAVAWTRDPVNMWAFHLSPPAGARSLQVEFTYLSPADEDVGTIEISPNIAQIEWLSVLLYPAGYFSRDIPVEASLTLPAGWEASSALERTGGQGATLTFARTPLNTLGDSPVYAGRYRRVIELGDAAGAPARLDLFADDPDDLEATPEQVAAHRALTEQARRLFGSHHFDHYDFLLSLSDDIPDNGLEHHQSSEDSYQPYYFTDWKKSVAGRDLLAHEYVHSWNGKFLRPADLWTPNYNVPMRNSLLWVYEGQTQYWGYVLAARSGLWSKPQALDAIAVLAARFDEGTPGRSWRALRDTVNDEIINPRRAFSWKSWSRFQDYYDEGLLIWLDADTLIRERSHGARSLDDFARRFFGGDNGSYVTRTYAFEDVVRALNAVEPYDWSGFLRARVDRSGAPAPTGGLERGGYRLVFTDKPGEFHESDEAMRKQTDLTYSIGAVVGEKGEVKSVLWDSPAFKAGLTSGQTVIAVNGVIWDADRLKGVIEHAKSEPGLKIELTVKDQSRVRTIAVDWHGGLRYPHLEKVGTAEGALDRILAAK